MHVCDSNNDPIPGLYGVGTVVGDMYGDVYDYKVPGINLGGACTTFGYLLGKNLSAGTWWDLPSPYDEGGPSAAFVGFRRIAHAARLLHGDPACVLRHLRRHGIFFVLRNRTPAVERLRQPLDHRDVVAGHHR